MTSATGQTRAMVTRREPPAGAGERTRIGIYLQPSEFEDAKAAYLADWSNGGRADTFAGWVAVPA